MKIKYIRERIKEILCVNPSMDERIHALREWGMIVGEDCYLAPDAEIESPWATHVKLGDRVTLARGVRFISHDACLWRSMGASRIGVIEVDDDVFIGAFSIVLPNIRIGKGAIVAAGSVVTKDVPEGLLVGGNPARVIQSVLALQEKVRTRMATAPTFGEEYRVKCGGTVEMRRQMRSAMPDGDGYILSVDALDQLGKRSI